MGPLTALASDDFYRALVGTDAPAGLLDAVSANIRSYAGWHISPQRTETLVVDGTGGQYLRLPTAHLVEVLSVTNDALPLDPTADITWNQQGILYYLHRWGTSLRGVTARVTHGWNLDEVGDVAVQTVLIAARVAASPRGEITSTVGTVSVQMSGAGFGFTPGEQASLDGYVAIVQ